MPQPENQKYAELCRCAITNEEILFPSDTLPAGREVEKPISKMGCTVCVDLRHEETRTIYLHSPSEPYEIAAARLGVALAGTEEARQVSQRAKEKTKISFH